MHAAGQTTQCSGLAEKYERRTNVLHIPFLTGPPSKSELQTDGYSQLKLRMDLQAWIINDVFRPCSLCICPCTVLYMHLLLMGVHILIQNCMNPMALLQWLCVVRIAVKDFTQSANAAVIKSVGLVFSSPYLPLIYFILLKAHRTRVVCSVSSWEEYYSSSALRVTS